MLRSMPSVRFSLSISTARGGDGPVSARSLTRYGALAEELGFHALYVTDHFLYSGPAMHSVSALAVLAGATTRVRLGFAAYVLPLRHPLQAAKELAMLDGLSEGRLIAAFAPGSYAPEFAAMGIPFAERGARLDEGLAAVCALWTERPASYEGRFYRFSGVTPEPGVVQRPHPPLWIGAWTGNERAARRVARFAAGWQASGLHTTVEEVRTGWAAIRRACALVDRDPATVGRAYVNAVTWLDADRERAWGTVTPGLREHEELRLIGTPDDAARKIEALAEAGIEEVAMLLPSWDEGQLRLIARELMPVFA